MKRKPKNKEEEDDEPTKKDRCPEGYKFGVDTEKYDECADCDIWDECLEAKRKRKR